MFFKRIPVSRVFNDFKSKIILPVNVTFKVGKCNINVRAIIYSVKKTIKRVGNLSSDVYFWNTPEFEDIAINCYDDACYINPRVYIIWIILLLCLVLMLLKYYDRKGDADSFE